MANFSRFYIELLIRFFLAVWNVISGVFTSIWSGFVAIKDYFDLFTTYSPKFQVIGWIIFVIVFSINMAFFTFIGLRIAQWIKRRIKYRARQVGKEELLEEISLLNAKVVELVDEKNKLFALKVSSIGLTPDRFGGMESGFGMNEKSSATDDVLKEGESRFVKLIAVDDAYEGVIPTVSMNELDMVSLPELVERFVKFSASQLRLYYSKKIISVWFAGLGTGKILILEGISGTGKTSLPYAMGKFFQNDAAIVSVQPSWRDRGEIIGYLNEFTKRFNETDFLKALYSTTYREDLNFIILDEMNLARIEYYFAEFLSIMEMPDVSEWKIDIVPESLPTDPNNVVNGKILVRQNVWFVGTANKDDSTFTITDKVYDRATTLEMNHRATPIDAPSSPPITMSYDYINDLFNEAANKNALGLKTLENIEKIDQYVAEKLKVTFGNRIMRQIKRFVPIYVGCGNSEVDGLDYVIRHKVFRKFEALNLAFLHNELEDLCTLLIKIFGKGTFQVSIDYIRDLIKNS